MRKTKRSYKTVLISFILHSQVLHRITGKIYNGCQAHVITARLDRQRRRFMQHSSVLDSWNKWFHSVPDEAPVSLTIKQVIKTVCFPGESDLRDETIPSALMKRSSLQPFVLITRITSHTPGFEKADASTFISGDQESLTICLCVYTDVLQFQCSYKRYQTINKGLS